MTRRKKPIAPQPSQETKKGACSQTPPVVPKSRQEEASTHNKPTEEELLPPAPAHPDNQPREEKNKKPGDRLMDYTG